MIQIQFIVFPPNFCCEIKVSDSVQRCLHEGSINGLETGSCVQDNGENVVFLRR